MGGVATVLMWLYVSLLITKRDASLLSSIVTGTWLRLTLTVIASIKLLLQAYLQLPLENYKHPQGAI